jgi:triosephosphate isomerase (TIM)
MNELTSPNTQLSTQPSTPFLRPDRWVIGNWKLQGALAANVELLAALVAGCQAGATKVAVCPPAVYLAQAQRSLLGSPIWLGAQDVSEHLAGAFTGQVSAAMLRDVGAKIVLVGHSERRQLNGETSTHVAAKAAAAVGSGLIPVICVGESLAQREAGLAEATVAAQLAPCAELFKASSANVVVAYEPVWAIGTGKTATPAEAQAMHAFIRAELRAINTAAARVSLLYGGSVKAANARALFDQPDIDGGLIGGASLIASDFLAIVSAAG